MISKVKHLVRVVDGQGESDEAAELTDRPGARKSVPASAAASVPAPARPAAAAARPDRALGVRIKGSRAGRCAAPRLPKRASDITAFALRLERGQSRQGSAAIERQSSTPLRPSMLRPCEGRRAAAGRDGSAAWLRRDQGQGCFSVWGASKSASRRWKRPAARSHLARSGRRANRPPDPYIDRAPEGRPRRT